MTQTPTAEEMRRAYDAWQESVRGLHGMAEDELEVALLRLKQRYHDFHDIMQRWTSQQIIGSVVSCTFTVPPMVNFKDEFDEWEVSFNETPLRDWFGKHPLVEGKTYRLTLEEVSQS